MDGSGQSFHWMDVAGMAACLLASAFFSFSETALTRVSDTQARHLIETKRYGILEFWLENKRRILSTLLVGNNLVNILCSILGYRVALHVVPGYAEVVSVFGVTAIILAFAEITPKSIALHYADRVVVPVLRIVWIVDKILWVVSWPLSRIPELILRRSGSEAVHPKVTEDEIEFHIRLGHHQKVFEEKEQGDLLMSALEFTDTTVKEVMIPRTDIFGLDVATPFAEVLGSVVEKGHSRVPVFRDDLDKIVGVLYAKDLLHHLEAPCGEGHPSLETIMRRTAFFVPETQRISDLLRDMRRRGLHMAIVVDEFGGTSGLITLEDVIEELVGEIRDEFDDDEPMIRRVDESTWIVDARVSIYDLRDATGVTLSDSGEYESVGGFVVAQHGSIPPKGAVIEAEGIRFTVLASDARRVQRLEMRKSPGEGPGRG